MTIDQKYRILALLCVLSYTMAFLWGYTEWVSPVWGYMFTISATSSENWFQCFAFCALPVFWMPLQHKRPTMLIYWIIYILTYIPMIVGVSLGVHFDEFQIFSFNLAAACGLYANGICYKFKLLTFKTVRLKKEVFWSLFFTIIIILSAYVYSVFGSSLRLVNPFSEFLYDKRFEGEAIETGTYVGYAILWMAGAFFPFLFAYGLFRSKKGFIFLSLVGQTYIYLTKADKAFLFSFIFLLLIAFLIYRTKYPGIFFTLIIAIFTVILTYIETKTTAALALIFFPIATTFLSRLTGASAFNAEIYYRFFEDGNPFTYYSHINLLQKVLKYPYSNIKIGEIVTGFYSESGNGFNANANYFITDGLVAAGVWGMVIAGFICSLVFYLMDSAGKRQSIILSTLAMGYSATTMMNVSIFTSFYSGGIFFTILFLIYFPIKRNVQTNLNY
jgi:hypothetical protein